MPPKRKWRQIKTTRLISEVLLFIHQILLADQQAPRKQRHTAQRIYERLRAKQDCKATASAGAGRIRYISQQYEAGRNRGGCPVKRDHKKLSAQSPSLSAR